MIHGIVTLPNQCCISKEGNSLSFQVATAIRGAIVAAKIAVIPVRRGYWGNNIGEVHTVPAKVGLFNLLVAFMVLLSSNLFI